MSIVSVHGPTMVGPAPSGGSAGDGDPGIASISPATLPATAGATLLTITGNDFVNTPAPGSKIEFNGAAVPTTYVSATVLTTSFDPTTAGVIGVTVRNPSGKESNTKPFVVTATQEDPPADPEPDPEPPCDTVYDEEAYSLYILAEHSISDVKDFLGHFELADEDYDALINEETAEANRVTLLEWLNAQKA